MKIPWKSRNSSPSASDKPLEFYHRFRNSLTVSAFMSARLRIWLLGICFAGGCGEATNRQVTESSAMTFDDVSAQIHADEQAGADE